jgi:hypothetical protein
MRTIRQWLLSIIGIILLVLITYSVQIYIAAKNLEGTPNFSSADIFQQIWWKILLLIVIMVVGIICNYIFERTKLMEDEIHIFKELRRMFIDPKFVMALVIAPFVFNTIYAATGDNPQTLGDYMLAFQNGFFWQSIITATIKAAATSEAKPAVPMPLTTPSNIVISADQEPMEKPIERMP